MAVSQSLTRKGPGSTPPMTPEPCCKRYVGIWRTIPHRETDVPSIGSIFSGTGKNGYSRVIHDYVYGMAHAYRYCLLFVECNLFSIPTKLCELAMA